MEATLMPILFWLALLLGYLTGVTAAVLLLPARLVEPLYGPLALTTALVVAAFTVLLRVRRVRRSADSESAVPPQQPPPGARSLLLGPDDEPDEPEDADRRGHDHERSQDERWPLMVRLEPPGVIGPSELRQILYHGRVDVRLRQLAGVAQPEATLYHALPRLRGVNDAPLEPASWLTTAARSGLLGMVDRLLLLRCVDLLRALRADAGEATVVCGIAAASLDDPGFVAELEQQLSEDPRLAEGLVLALDQVVHDRPRRAAATGMRARGLRFCLRRLGPPPLDPAPLRAAGFAFVLLEAERYARAQGGELEPALLELQKVFGADGPQLLIARAGALSVTLSGDRAPFAADSRSVLARPSAA
jgi:cyclic-di-GMP phosphodiesterase TipF (flagellum assembly factor)